MEQRDGFQTLEHDAPMSKPNKEDPLNRNWTTVGRGLTMVYTGAIMVLSALPCFVLGALAAFPGGTIYLSAFVGKLPTCLWISMLKVLNRFHSRYYSKGRLFAGPIRETDYREHNA